MFITYPTGVMFSQMRRSDCKKKFRLRSSVIGIIQTSKTDSTSFVKDQSERRCARDAEPEVMNQAIRYAIRSCSPQPQSKDPSFIPMARSPAALGIGTFHSEFAPRVYALVILKARLIDARRNCNFKTVSSRLKVRSARGSAWDDTALGPDSSGRSRAKCAANPER